MTESQDFPALRLLLQGYLGLDWPEEYGDPWTAVEDFVKSEPASASRITIEVGRVLEGAAEDGLHHLMVSDLSSGYLPPADGWTWRSWLEEVVRRVEGR
ncbi:MAG: contact-dependent growth inhibition system immunity protein [Microthrixaceae bacterium]